VCLSGLCSETPGYIRPEGAFHPELIVAADDVHTLCMIGTGMAAGHPIDEELRARCQWHENIPDVKVWVHGTVRTLQLLVPQTMSVKACRVLQAPQM
jgi:hypothetical protein